MPITRVLIAALLLFVDPGPATAQTEQTKDAAVRPAASFEGLRIVARKRAVRTSGPPIVRAKEPTVGPAGPLDEAVLRRCFLRQAHAALLACYKDVLRAVPTLSGRLRVRFVVAASGAVRSAELVQGLHGELDACALAAVQKTEFPAPYGGGAVTVVYPFEFLPEG